MSTYDQALKEFEGSVINLTYFEYREHTTIADLCYLCLHELDLHAEQEYWHPMKERRDLLKFCKKWGPYAQEEGSMDYAAEAQKQFDIGKNHKKEDAYI
jgi:hypothetical protein